MDGGAIRLVAGGHAFRTNENGRVDIWASDYDIHNGPVCVVCDDGFCVHCDSNWKTEKCKEYHETLDDLDFPIVSEDATTSL